MIQENKTEHLSFVAFHDEWYELIFLIPNSNLHRNEGTSRFERFHLSDVECFLEQNPATKKYDNTAFELFRIPIIKNQKEGQLNNE